MKGKRIEFAFNNSLWLIIFGDTNERFLSICSNLWKSSLESSNWGGRSTQKEFLE